ncbi:MAG: hypothetical protein WCO02_15105 [Bacteroidota bacterium]
MNRQQFSELIKEPGALGAESVIELESLLRQYPYCTSAQLLLALVLLQQNHPNYQSQFKKAVAYAGDRRRLKELLEGKRTFVTVKQPAVEASLENEDPLQIPAAEASDGTVAAGIAEIQTAIVAETQAEEQDVALLLRVPEPKHENFIEESVISEEELALASPDLRAEDVPVHAESRPLHTLNRQTEISKEKLSQEDLLTIVRKRLAEINAEKSISVQKTETPATDKEPRPSEAPGGQSSAVNRSKEEIIETFIREEPQISRPKKEFFSPTSSSQRSNMDEEDIISETLALLYAKQGNMQKAIHIYEKLSLRFSEKSRYFAARIENLKGNAQQP